MSSIVNSSGNIDHVEQNVVALFELGGIIHEQFGQFGITRISHSRD